MKLLGSADVGLLINRMKFVLLGVLIYYMAQSTYQLGLEIQYFVKQIPNFKSR